MVYLPVVLTLLVVAALVLNTWVNRQAGAEAGVQGFLLELMKRRRETANAKHRSSDATAGPGRRALTPPAAAISGAPEQPSRPDSRLATAALPLALGGLLLLVLANAGLNGQELTFLTVSMMVVGAALWSRYLWRNPQWRIDTADRPTEDRARLTLQLSLLLVAGICGVIAWRDATGNQFRIDGVVAWGVAALAWLAAWWPWRRRENWLRSRQERTLQASEQWTLAFALLATTTIGIFYRYFRIRITPGDPTSDHAEKVGDVNNLLHGAHYVFFEANTGREPAQFYLTAAMIRLFDLPVDWNALKLGTAAIGVLTVPFIYLFASEIAGRIAGLTAAALFAVSKWPVAISRSGLRFPYAVLWGTITLWLLLRWMRTGDRRDAFLCGAALGCGLYGYTPFRVVAIVVAMGFAIEMIDPRWKGKRRQVIAHGLLALGTALVVFIPLGRYAWDKPDMFFFRTTNSMKAPDGTPLVDQFTILLHNTWNFVLAFNWRGDSTMVNMVSYEPFLDVVTGGLLLSGVIAVAISVARARDARLILLLLATPVLMLSSTLVLGQTGENPSVNRGGPVIPVIFLICALPVSILLPAIRSQFRLSRPKASLLLVTITALFLYIGSQNYHSHFNEFQRQQDITLAPTTRIARTIESYFDAGVRLENVWVADYPYWLDIRNIGFTLGYPSGPRGTISWWETLSRPFQWENQRSS